MTADDIVKGVFGVLITGISGFLAWALKLTLGNREDLLQAQARLKSLEDTLAEVKKDRVTVECVREVISEELDKRDKVADQRRDEWEKRRKLETREVVAEELDRLVPRLANEIRGMHGGKGISK